MGKIGKGDISRMTPEAQLRAIAEAFRWKCVRRCIDSPSGVVGYSPSDPFPHDKGEQFIPDFANDLNAMHGAVMAKPRGFRLLFEHATKGFAVKSGLLVCELTATVHAEIFLTVEREWRNRTPRRSLPENTR